MTTDPQTQKFNAIIALERKFRPTTTVKAEITAAYNSMDFAEFKAFKAYRTEKGI